MRGLLLRKLNFMQCMPLQPVPSSKGALGRAVSAEAAGVGCSGCRPGPEQGRRPLKLAQRRQLKKPSIDGPEQESSKGILYCKRLYLETPASSTTRLMGFIGKGFVSP